MQLAIQKQSKKLEQCLSVVPHSYSEDGLLRFGDYIMLKHDLTGTVLSCDTFESLEPGIAHKYLVTSGYNPNPVARNVFRIVRPPRKLQNLGDNNDDNLLRVGNAFCLCCNEALLIQPDSHILSPPLFLSSIKKSERSATVNSNRQMVYLSPALDANAVWTVSLPSLGRINASERYLAAGSPVYGGESIQLNHRQSNMYISCDSRFTEITDFGTELEVFADRSSGFGKIDLIQSEFKGLSTTGTLTKPDAPSFTWQFVTASVPEAATDRRSIPDPPHVEDLITALRLKLLRKGGKMCFWDFRRFFQRAFTDFNGKIDYEDLKLGIAQLGVTMEDTYLDRIISELDVHEGLVDIDTFIRCIRGNASEKRVMLIREVFVSVSGQQEKLSFETAKEVFNSRFHPLHEQGKGPREILEHVFNLGLSKSVGKVSIRRDDFENYYLDLSAAIQDDYEFEKIMEGSWSFSAANH